ncbi:hypothetical protein VFPPC_18331 [Pochonia chlamydosporia 170]|uniref:Uncharacterized protein n=1 Tax=Pochonia chlamydosporia 170 TaxID=1380566 RepID=A0A219APK3_METCM|nr:hypothetical protein VFPPC_18331 [Pochonia chlamydosporia 170]OWT42529.1 hypothetical protein VFPPC_18331 [Pochonia chlamydosporia 170]
MGQPPSMDVSVALLRVTGNTAESRLMASGETSAQNSAYTNHPLPPLSSFETNTATTLAVTNKVRARRNNSGQNTNGINGDRSCSSGKGTNTIVKQGGS